MKKTQKNAVIVEVSTFARPCKKTRMYLMYNRYYRTAYLLTLQVAGNALFLENMGYNRDVKKNFNLKAIKPGGLILMNRQDIRDEINSRPLTDFVSLERSPKAGANMYVCPVCNSGTGKDKTGALSLTARGNRHRVTCFSAHACFTEQGEDTLGALKIIWNCDETEAMIKAGYTIDGYDPNAIKETPAGYEADYKQWNRNINVPGNAGFNYLKDRGISLETINALNIGYCENWKHPKKTHSAESPRIILPASNMSYTARETRADVEADKKLKVKYGDSVYWAFNLQALDTEQTAPVFITEGEIDALSIIEAGGIALATGSANYTNKFCEAVKKKTLPKTFVIAMDNDEAGITAKDRLLKAFNEYEINSKVYVINPYGDYKDANEALVNDKTAFIEAVKGITLNPAYWVARQTNNTINKLQGFIDDIDKSVNTPAVPTGFKELDKALDGGLYEGLYTIIARTGAGKTTFCLQVCDNIAQAGHKVFYYNLEMSTNELIARSVSRHTYINTLNGIISTDTGDAKTARGILDGKRYITELDANGNVLAGYTQKEKQLISASINDYANYCENIRFFETLGYMDTDKIRQAVDYEIKLTGKAPVICVDYLQMLSLGIGLADNTKGLSEYTCINKAILDLKQISRDFKTPVIVISSVNRESSKSGKTLALESAKESGGIDFTTDVGLVLDFADTENNDFDIDNAGTDEDVRKMVLKAVKNRNGRKGVKVYMDYVPMFNYFEDTGTGKPAVKYNKY